MKRAVAAVLGLVIVVAAVWGLVTYGSDLRWYIRVRWSAIRASRREPAALEAWRKEFGDSAATLAALPAHDDNATAVRLVELAPGAGVDFKVPAESTPSEHAIRSYVNAESMQAGGPVGPPPEAVRSYLDAHQPGLDAIVDLLTRGEPPAWKTEEWLKPPSTPLSAIITLDHVLIAEALAKSSRGRDADAERALLASWQLNASLRDLPNIVEQLMVAQTTSIHASLARRLAIDLALWRVRLGEHDYQASMMRAMGLRAGRMLSVGTSQMERAARADYLDLMRAELVRLRDLPVTSPQDGGVNEVDAKRKGWSVGAIVAAIERPGDERTWIGTECVMLQLELTDRVLRARQLKAQLGRWPAAIPDIEKSRVPGAHWIYVVGQDGRMSIALGERLQSTGPPLRFESSGSIK